jgi:stringent starvation protein B
MEYVKNNEIVLNVGFEATSGLKLGNEFIEFKARFGGVSRDIVVPVDHVVAIYARENGQGMAFPVPTGSATGAAADAWRACAAQRGTGARAAPGHDRARACDDARRAARSATARVRSDPRSSASSRRRAAALEFGKIVRCRLSSVGRAPAL